MSLPVLENTQENKDPKYNFHRNNILRVSQASKLLGVSPSTLRRFENDGLISSSRNPKNNYRMYDLGSINELKHKLENKRPKEKISRATSKKIKNKVEESPREKKAHKISKGIEYKETSEINIDSSEKYLTNKLWNKAKFGTIFLIISLFATVSFAFISSNKAVSNKISSFPLYKALGIKTEKELGENISKNSGGKVLAARIR